MVKLALVRVTTRAMCSATRDSLFRVPQTVPHLKPLSQYAALPCVAEAESGASNSEWEAVTTRPTFFRVATKTRELKCF
jgi:hypothetical protein